jgi:translation initiation factor 6
MLKLGDINGNSYVGVYCAASETHAIVPDSVDSKTAKDISRTLGVTTIQTNIAGGTIVGALVAMNSNGIILTNFAEKGEIASLPKELRVAKMEVRINAAGNNILTNDRAAIVHPAASNRIVKVISDTLGVEVDRRRVAGVDTVGSACIATSKGVVCHPRTTEDELRALSAFFKVPAAIATLNYGTPYLGACAIANSKGALVGSRSTPIELGRLEDGLVLY